MDEREAAAVPEERAEPHYDHQRLGALQDGVYAIAMTLLAFDLKPAKGWDGSLGGLYAAIRVPLVAYLISFALVAISWIRQRRIFSRLLRVDAALTALTFAVLAVVTLIPAAARLSMDAGRTGDAVWIALLAASGLIGAAEWAYAGARPHLLRPGVDRAVRRDELARQFIAPLAILGYGALRALPDGRDLAVPALVLGLLVMGAWRRAGRRRRP